MPHRDILSVMKPQLALPFAAAMIVLSILPAFADYTILLKNGRQIIVQTFREEAGMVKFSGFGGEISILKDQIQAIRPSGEAKPPNPLSRSAPATATERQAPASEERQTAPRTVEEEIRNSGKEVAEQNAKQEETYQQHIKKINSQLKELRGRYATETRGNTGSDPILFTTEEAFKGHQEDLLSRLRDAQYKAQSLPSGREAQSPPLSTNPPPPYTEKQRLLSDLRHQLNELESERERLIAEMKEKKFDTSSLSLE